MIVVYRVRRAAGVKPDLELLKGRRALAALRALSVRSLICPWNCRFFWNIAPRIFMVSFFLESVEQGRWSSLAGS